MLVLSDVLEPVKTSSSLATVKKQPNRVKSEKTVELPLNKEEVERVSYKEYGPLRGRNGTDKEKLDKKRRKGEA